MTRKLFFQHQLITLDQFSNYFQNFHRKLQTDDKVFWSLKSAMILKVSDLYTSGLIKLDCTKTIKLAK